MNAAWLSWNNHRRSRELSRELEMPFVPIRSSRRPSVALFIKIFQTVRFLARTDVDTLVVQNPSLLSTVLAAWMKRRKHYRLIQDLHPSFAVHMNASETRWQRFIRRMMRYCIRQSDLTIVSSPELTSLVERNGGRGLVLEDAIPVFAVKPDVVRGTDRRIVYVCGYRADEPFDEVFKAGRALAGEVMLYVTGRIPKGMRTWTVPAGVHLTDFLPEQEYLALLESADAVIALTTREHALLSGAYEALAFKKPLILSNKPALREHFGERVLYVDNNAGSIADGIRKLYSAKPFFDRHAAELAMTLSRSWSQRFEKLREYVERP